MVRATQNDHSSQQATTTSMYSVSIIPPASAPPTVTAAATRNSFRPHWHWSNPQYRELVAMYMDFVDHVESTTGTSPINPHLNPVLIKQVFTKFSRVAPRDSVICKLKDCHTLEEEPFELAMNPMASTYDTYTHRPKVNVNIRHRNQWDILKVERMKDQIVNYQHQLTLIKHVALTRNILQLIRTITSKIEERQRCLQLHPTRYYRPGP
jgi:hypothetical protein